MFIDDMSMMLLTLPVVYPVMMALGFDGIWFGIMMILYIMMGQITPPFGFTLYVVHGLTGRKYLNDIIWGSLPFFFCMALLLIILTIFPDLVLWLPDMMFSPWK